MRKFASLAILLAITPTLAFAEQHGAPVGHSEIHKTTQTETHQTQSHTQNHTMTQPNHTMTQPAATKQTMSKETWTTTSVSSAEPAMTTQFAQAQVQLINKQYPEAVQTFETILSSQPENVPALNSLATAFYAQGRYVEAAQVIDKAITLDPVNSSLFLTKAKIQDAQNKSLEALQSYLTFTAISPDDGAALDAQRRAGELYKLEEAKLSPAEQNFYQGQRLLSLRQPAQAIPLFQKYQAMTPNDPQASLMLGKAYLELGQAEKAIPQFESAVKLKADNAAAYYHLGSSYEIQGKAQNAKAAYQQFLRFAPKSESAMLLNKRMEVQQ